MRFKASVKNIHTFTKLTASLNLLGNVAWVRLDEEQVRFTVIPEQGSQVWAVLGIETIFDDDDYTIQSAAERNAINLEVPLAPLHRALQSAQNAHSASLRLTKKDNVPLLSLTIIASTSLTGPGRPVGGGGSSLGANSHARYNSNNNAVLPSAHVPTAEDAGHDREATITQDVAVRVLAAASVAGIHEPRCREPEVHILLPPLPQLKAISERLTKLALTTTSSSSGKSAPSAGGTVVGLQGLLSKGPRLEIAANMHGELKLGIRTDALSIESRWEGLSNPELDPSVVEGGEEGVRAHPSTRMKHVSGDEAWAVVRVEGRDWGRVLGVGRMGGRVVACFCHDLALILYVYLPNELDGGEESVLTYYIGSYSS